MCGTQWPAQGRGVPIQLPSPIAALNASKDTNHTSQSWVDKRSLEPERLCLSGSGGLQEESFLSRGSLISPTQCFGFKVQKHVMFKRLQLCCLKVNSGHRAVGQHEGFLLCLQPILGSMLWCEHTFTCPLSSLLEVSVKAGILPDPRTLCGPEARASGGRAWLPWCPGVGASSAAALWGAGILPFGSI